MLVLTRREGERIVIGDDIVVTLVSVRGSKVRLGISAPPDVDIIRDDHLLSYMSRDEIEKMLHELDRERRGARKKPQPAN